MNFLADNSLVFDNAYASIPQAPPSRTSILTSLLPMQLGIFNNAPTTSSPALSPIAQATVLPEYVTSATGTSVGIGRIFYVQSDTNSLNGLTDSTTPLKGSQDDLCSPDDVCQIDATGLTDQDVASLAITFIRDAVQRNLRFALTVGLYRPYGNYSMPPWAYAQIVQRGSQILAAVAKDSGMLDLPALDVQALQAVYGNTRLSEAQVVQLKTDIWATAQWVDFSLGRILDEVRGLGLFDNTIIVVSADQGFAHGEFSQFGPASLYEHTTRVPLMIHDARFAQSMGQRTSSRVSLVDLASSIYALLGMPQPRGKAKTPFTGVPFAGLLNIAGNTFDDSVLANATGGEPVSGANISLRFSALSVAPRCTLTAVPFDGTPSGQVYTGPFTDCFTQPVANRADVMGLSIRTALYRYTEWRSTQNDVVRWDSAALVARELYSHAGDTGLVGVAGNTYERVNLAACASCAVVVNPPMAMSSGSALLPGDTPGVDYSSPSLPANQALAALVRAYTVTLRGLARDNAAPCSDHGLVNPDDGSCAQCDVGWSDAECSTPALPEMDPGWVVVPPTSQPTAFSNAPSNPPVGAPTLPLPPSMSTASPTTLCDRPTLATCENFSKFCQWVDGQGCVQIVPTAQPTTGTPLVSPTTHMPSPKPTKPPTSHRPTGQPVVDASPSSKPSAGLTMQPTPSVNYYTSPTAPTLQPQPVVIVSNGRTCASITSASTCQRINGCVWKGVNGGGCQAPNPLPCGCPAALVPVQGVFSPNTLVETFRNACHLSCKGATLVLDNSDSPTVATEQPVQATVPPGEPLPTRPGEGNALPVSSLDMTYVVDASASVNSDSQKCLFQGATASCWWLVSKFLETTHAVLLNMTTAGYGDFVNTGLRITIATSSCSIGTKVVVDGASSWQNALMGFANLQAITPLGTRCPGPAFAAALVVDETVDTARRPNRAVLLTLDGYLTDDAFAGMAATGNTLRSRGVATYVVMQSAQRTDVGGSGMTPDELVTMRAQALAIAGAAERVFNVGPTGWGPLMGLVKPVAAAVLATVHEPSRVTSNDVSDDPANGGIESFKPGSSSVDGAAAAGSVVGCVALAAVAAVAYSRRRRLASAPSMSELVVDVRHRFRSRAAAAGFARKHDGAVQPSQGPVWDGDDAERGAPLDGVLGRVSESELTAKASPVRQARRRSQEHVVVVLQQPDFLA